MLRLRQEGVGMRYRLGRLCAVTFVILLAFVWLSGCSTTSSPSNARPGDVFGYVVNAMTGGPIEDATVTVDGAATTSDSLGYYIVDDVDAGAVIVLASATGFVDLTTAVVVPDGGSVRRDCVLITSTTGDEYRFVLAWGEDPRDLDSHLWVPTGGGLYYHVYYSDEGSITEVPYAELDNDETEGYGPETVTVLTEYSDLYVYGVYHYDGDGTLRTSEAILRIYQGNDLRYTLLVPDEYCEDEWWWNVCTFNAVTGVFTIIDTLQEDPPFPTVRGDK